VLAVIDDVQWLDEPSLEALLFAGRRLGAEGIAMIGAPRDSTAVARTEAPWLERLAIGPLDDAESRAVFASDDGAERIAPAVADRLVGTAGGNPLALVELPSVLSDAQLTGREPLEEPLRPGATVERAFRMRLDALPETARRALLVAATVHSLRVDVIQAGVRAAGLAMTDLAADEDARLVSVRRGELEFRHPLLRSTAYHAATAAERRAAHAARRRGARGERTARLASRRAGARARRGDRRRARRGGARRPRPRRPCERGARLLPRCAAHAG
jgi:hypothetical protein